jgi:hypothetical protein
VSTGYAGGEEQLLFGIARARDQCNQKTQGKREPLQASRCSASVSVSQQQSQIRSRHMDQQPLENVVMFSQMGAPHAPGVIAVGEGPLDPFSALSLV